MDLLSLIPYGKENAISRRELERLTGQNDRKTRKQIKALIQQGHAILSSSSARGYWRSEDPAEIAAFIRESDHRRRTESLTVEPLRRILAEKKGEQVIFVSGYTRRLRKPPEPQQQIDGQIQFTE